MHLFFPRSSIAVVAAFLPAFHLASAEDIGPRVGIIEIYGAHKVSANRIKTALGIAEGDRLPASKGDAEERLGQVHGVVSSRLEADCCLAGKSILYVGVEERDAPHFAFRTPPSGDASLPEDLVKNYRSFLDSVSLAASRTKEPREDLTNGYSLMANPECRDFQESFIQSAAAHSTELHHAIRESKDDEQRAIAAYLLQYAPRDAGTTTGIVADLQYALQDANDSVRKNATRALGAMAIAVKLHPEQNIVIEPTWFVELMNSVVWSDRRNASRALVNLTDTRNDWTLDYIRERALNSIVEMARWHDLQYALPAFILAGRLAGLPEKQIQESWVRGDRETVLKQALKSTKHRG